MNRFFTLLLAASCLTAVGQVPDYVPTEGLLGLWPLNGSAGDLTGNYLNSSVVGGEFTEDRLGNTNSALMLNGSDEYVVINGPIEAEDFTIALWVFAENEQNSVQTEVYPLVYVGIDSGVSPADCNGFGMALTSAEMVALFGCVSGPFGSSEPTPAVYGSWTHCALSFSSGEGTMTYFVNGEQFGASELNSTFLPPSSHIFFGAVHFTSYSKFHGALDEIGIWNRALSLEEIQEVYIGTPPLVGCTDESACNYDADATVDDDSCTYSGCIDSGACNFQEDAACDDGSCDYSCCPGPGCCSQGLFWDWELEQCFPTNPADINLDGCVQLNDLLDLLGAYGDCGAEESGWQCGDPLEYQGYDYETVQIGEQCWFAENLRAENYRNGEPISNPNNANAYASLVEDGLGTFCPYDFDETNGMIRGYLYNGYAVISEFGLCPSNWHVPSYNDFLELTAFVNPYEDYAGGPLKKTGDVNSGGYWEVPNTGATNETGFSGIGSGTLRYYGAGTEDAGYEFAELNKDAQFWTSDNSPCGGGCEGLWIKRLRHDALGFTWNADGVINSMAVRCIED